MGIFNKNEKQEEGQVPAQIPDPEPEQEEAPLLGSPLKDKRLRDAQKK